ncbi:endoglucanase [Dyadobacter jejuensis]|uniref:Endoglucanase n=1 Tax=Dyadobacter jejuensis TaxID=1082580 RepID=A0A316AD28_9BACT|nr:glycoside hydrolase family 9 protein [Dyadobacter jejuensis]PWJ55541.1 endoglucanase [Dyadobacter jejuensis]
MSGLNRNKTVVCLRFVILIFILETSWGYAQSSTSIRLNQVGFYPHAPKVAVVVNPTGTEFVVKDARTKKVALKGELGKELENQFSGKKSRVADFSGLKKQGEFYIEIVGGAKSANFKINKRVHQEVAAAALKGFYYQRASTALPEQYAGKWARQAGHPDDRVAIHASAISSSRPEGSVMSAPQGWYDAGDYNKYIVNSGITMGTLLSLYEDYPEFCKGLDTNIPESANAVPDILDEILWNLRWMLQMQDPADGGVYHKLTNANFDGTIMPEAATKPRYVVEKSTAAALNFAAVTAQSYRVYSKFEKDFPGLADSCLAASKKAWKWAERNPDLFYVQEEMNKKFDPDVTTGAYGDGHVEDEWSWAATELYVSTGEDGFLKRANYADELRLPSWNQVSALSNYALLKSTSRHKSEAGKAIIQFADKLLKDVDRQPFQTVMGKSVWDFSWGSNSVAANQGIALLQAYKLTDDIKYAQAALGNLDYLLGRNATNYCFLTGFGTNPVMHPHHRPSAADGVVEPVPGLLSGGPNPGKQDKCTTYTSNSPDESFTDDYCSYASNEIAINWNAPMVYLVAALEAIFGK